MSVVLKGHIFQDGKDGPWRAEIRELGIRLKGTDWKAVTEKLDTELNDIADAFDWEMKLPDQGTAGCISLETDDYIDLAILILHRKHRPR